MSLSSASVQEDESLQQELHQDGRRLTPQRKRVLELFERRGSGCHLSAEEVHQQLVELDLKVSLATVYRTLRLLADMGFLQELELTEGGAWSARPLRPHDHPTMTPPQTDAAPSGARRPV